jgi:5'-nucleotidase
MANKLPLILITNDDSIDAPGIHALIDYVKDMGQVVAVAPSDPHSGQSSAISVNRALNITKHPDYNGAQMYAVNGTPVDCIKLAMHALIDRRPDLILSGINHGSNSGNSIIYSGTMGAVLEGCMLGIPSIGYSFHSHDWKFNIEACREVVTEITSRVIANGLPKDICLNVNIPKCEKVNGLKVVRAARGYWTEEYADYLDPHGNPFYWLTGRFFNEEPDNPDTDLYWTDRGYASVVPCRPDQSANDAIPAITSLLD